jgi:SMI1-KNR4 cell-wall
LIVEVLITSSARIQFLAAIKTIRRNNRVAAHRFRLQAEKMLTSSDKTGGSCYSTVLLSSRIVIFTLWSRRMDHIDESLWAKVLGAEDTELADPAPAEAIEAFEATHGVALPSAHREFLLRANGGCVGYSRLFGVGRADFLDLDRMVSEMRPYIECMADGPVLPFASDWGGSYFCYDLHRLGETGRSAVLFWNHEYSEEPDDRPMLWSEFATDFVAFLRKVTSE